MSHIANAWIPRLLGTLVAAFLALFALDSVAATRSVGESIAAVVIHLTPACIVLVAVILAWRRPLVGAFLFAGLAAGYAAIARRPDWIAVISGPLLIVATSFAWSGWCARRDSVLRARG